MKVESVRYAGCYTGPSYGTGDYRDSLEGFTSLEDAREQYQNRVASSGSHRLPAHNLKLGPAGRIVSVEDTSTYWPATTPQDTLDLYRVYQGEIAAEPFARFITGPRGGAVREDY